MPTAWSKQPSSLPVLSQLAGLVDTLRRLQLLAKLVQARQALEAEAKAAKARQKP